MKLISWLVVSCLLLDSCWLLSVFTMDSGTAAASDSSHTYNFVGSSSGSSRFHKGLSITSTPWNGKNKKYYAIWAKAVEIYYLNESKFHYLTDDPPHLPEEVDKISTVWITEDARIRVKLWNSIEPHISW